MDNAQWVREAWAAVLVGDLAPLGAALAPDAVWRPVVEGPWNCESRTAIVNAMSYMVTKGLTGSIDDVTDVGDRVVVGFRPDHHAPQAWPLDNGVRYLVATVSDGLVTELKGCATQAAALAYAAAGGASGGQDGDGDEDRVVEEVGDDRPQ
jgi:ketosteroid isomerase-like protein